MSIKARVRSEGCCCQRRLRSLIAACLLGLGTQAGCTRDQDLTRCRTDIDALLRAVETYARDTGSVPNRDEGLELLVRKGYLRFVPRDPWGKPYQYAVENTGDSKHRVSIASQLSAEREIVTR